MFHHNHVIRLQRTLPPRTEKSLYSVAILVSLHLRLLLDECFLCQIGTLSAAFQRSLQVQILGERMQSGTPTSTLDGT